MLHGRVVRGPSEGTVLDLPAAAEIEAMPGVFKFIRNGAFAAGLAEKKWDAIQAMRRLQARPFHRAGPPLPAGDVADTLKALPSRDIGILDVVNPAAAPTKTVLARYTRPWINHGSIGPSCALALG